MLSATVQRNYYGAIAGKWLKEVCYACGAHYIDAHQDSGFNRLYATQNGDGVHPNSTWRQYIASYVADEIKKQYNFKPVI
jgi:lysophospholipase L1-like esterase